MVRVWFAVFVWGLGLALPQTGLPLIPVQSPLYGPFQVERVLTGNRFLVADRVFQLAGVEVFAADERAARAQAQRLKLTYTPFAHEQARTCLANFLRERPVYLELEDPGVLGDALWGYLYFPYDTSPSRMIPLERPLFLHGNTLLDSANTVVLRYGCGWFNEPKPLRYREALLWVQEKAKTEQMGVWRP